MIPRPYATTEDRTPFRELDAYDVPRLAHRIIPLVEQFERTLATVIQIERTPLDETRHPLATPELVDRHYDDAYGPTGIRTTRRVDAHYELFTRYRALRYVDSLDSPFVGGYTLVAPYDRVTRPRPSELRQLANDYLDALADRYGCDRRTVDRWVDLVIETDVAGLQEREQILASLSAVSKQRRVRAAHVLLQLANDPDRLNQFRSVTPTGDQFTMQHT